jgi:hypothetical protein
MKIYVLSDITLVSSTVTGSTYAEYASGTTYATGNKVKVSYESNGTTPRFPVVEYESLADSNVGNYPPDSPDKWSELGAENRCMMFDNYVNTQTWDEADIVVVLDADGFDCVGIFDIYGTDVTLTFKRSGTVIKTETIDLRTIIPASGWYNWLYNSYEWGITQILWEFPKYVSDATLEITITTRAGWDSFWAGCGMVVMGNAKTLGITKYTPKIGIDDYSVKDTDSLGRTYLNQGNYAKRADVSMWLMNNRVDYVAQQLTAIRGVPAVFDLNNDDIDEPYQSLQIYGYVQNFDVIIPGPIRSECNLEIKGLI